MRTIIFSIFALCFACNVAASSKKCDQVYVLAISAVSNRDEGLTQDQLRRPLPPKDSANLNLDSFEKGVLKTMYEIVDEIYVGRDLDGQTYAVFKSEQCRLRTIENPMDTDFQKIIPLLRECVPLKGTAKIYCAIRVADSAKQLTENGPVILAPTKIDPSH